MGGSGVQRPLKFVKYLRDFGWNPIVIAPEPGIYHTFDTSLQEELDALDIEVHRVKANTPFHKMGGKQRTLSIIPEWLAKSLRFVSTFFWLPDNKKGWINPAVEKAKEVISKTDVSAVFSTAAPYSNHLIAARLKEDTGLPVIMDLRDDWLDSHLITYPTPFHKKRMADIERETLSKADAITVINEDTKQGLNKRLDTRLRIMLLNQGFDPEDFNRVNQQRDETPKRLKLLYSGLFYGERNPNIFLKAISELIEESVIKKTHIELHFQGGLNEEIVSLIDKLKLQDIVQDYGYVNHDEAILNLLKADILWLIVGHTHKANQVTVGKMFEYFGSGKPILGLVPEGSSKNLLEAYSASFIAEPYDLNAVKNELSSIYKSWINEKLPKPNEAFVSTFNRKHIAGELGRLLQEVSS